MIASSDKNVSSTLVNLTRCAVRGRLVIKVENRSLKSLVNGRSSSVIRNILEDVWCILLLATLSVVDMEVVVGECVPLSVAVGTVTVGGEVILRAKEGRNVKAALEDLVVKLPDEVAERKDGVDDVDILARLTTLSLAEANAARDLLLLLEVMFETEAECEWPGCRGGWL